MTQNWHGLVASIKLDLVAKGQTFTTNEDAFAITGRVGWALRMHGAQLIVKQPAQNGAWVTIDGKRVKVSHDALSFPDGWADLLVGAGPPNNQNDPAWQWHPGAPAGLLVAPFDMDEGLVEPVEPDPVEPPPPPPQPSIDVLSAIKELRADLVSLNGVLALDRTAFGAALVRIEEQQKRGLGGSVIGYRVRLVP